MHTAKELRAITNKRLMEEAQARKEKDEREAADKAEKLIEACARRAFAGYDDLCEVGNLTKPIIKILKSKGYSVKRHKISIYGFYILDYRICW